MSERWVAVIGIALVAAFTSCISRGVDVVPFLPPTVDPTVDDLVAEVNRFEEIRSLVLRVDLQFETIEEAEQGRGKKYRAAQGRLLLRRPSSIRLNIEAPILSANIAEMASDGEHFQLLIHPVEHRALIVGSNGVRYEEEEARIAQDPELSRAGPLVNIRPQHITDAFLIPPVSVYDIPIRSEQFLIEPDTRPGAEVGDRVKKSYYILTTIRRDESRPRVQYWFDRVGTLTLRRLQIFDEAGRLESDVRYQDYLFDGGRRLPSQVRVERPHDDYTLVVNVRPGGLQTNRELPDTAFVVTPPAEWAGSLRRIDLDDRAKAGTESEAILGGGRQMSDTQPIGMCCIYQIKTGRDEDFRALLEKHWPALNRVGLVSPKPARFYRGSNKAGATFFVEMFEWRDGNSSDVAHQSPEVMSVWEPMGALTDHMEFIQLDGVEG